MPERPIFWHYPHYGNQGGTPASSVVMGDYKYIEFFEDSRGELYDLKADFSETNNLCEKMPETGCTARIASSWLAPGGLCPFSGRECGICADVMKRLKKKSEDSWVQNVD